jgi:hypothetical protein
MVEDVTALEQEKPAAERAHHDLQAGASTVWHGESKRIFAGERQIVIENPPATPASCRYTLTILIEFLFNTQLRSTTRQVGAALDVCSHRFVQTGRTGLVTTHHRSYALWISWPLKNQCTIACRPVLVPSDIESKINTSSSERQEVVEN